MPTPEQKHPGAEVNETAKRMLRDIATHDTSNAHLIAEIAALRKEIRDLRQDLSQVPSLIVTGRQAIDEFKRLTQQPI